MHFPFLSLLLSLITTAHCRAVKFAEGTKASPSPTHAPPHVKPQSRELSDAELRKIVAERPEDDPLNAFYDPYEPYRLSTYAYWHPITDPQAHANPLLPSSFLPPSAPPSGFPVDFFHDDEGARKLVLDEHAAAFCPFLRRWREAHPLRPYPIAPDFIRKHPPIKFNPRTGYQLDTELSHLKSLVHRIRLQSVNRDDGEDGEGSDSDSDDSTSSSNSNTSSTSTSSSSASTATVDPAILLQKLKTAIKTVKKTHKRRGSHRCLQSGDFTHQRTIKLTGQLDASIGCLEEAIFVMEAEEDLMNPVEREEGVGERADKFAWLLSLLFEESGDGDGNGNGNGNSHHNGQHNGHHIGHHKGKQRKSSIHALRVPAKELAFRGTVPDWARVGDGEELFSSGEEVLLPETYPFPYSPVPLPSIQSTLQKFVNI